MRFDDRPLVRIERKGHLRKGVTLVELLVVITLLLLITAITIPVIAPAVQQHRVRRSGPAYQ